MRSIEPPEVFRNPPDCLAICTDHSMFDYAAIANSGVPVVDTRNALSEFTAETIFRL
jgi:hypothetical protein